MPNPPPPFPGFLGQVPIIGPVYELGGRLLGYVNAKGQFIKAAGNLEKKVGETAVKALIPKGWENWILRIGEIILGVVLIGVGVAKLTGVDNYVMKTATKLGKAAILA